MSIPKFDATGLVKERRELIKKAFSLNYADRFALYFCFLRAIGDCRGAVPTDQERRAIKQNLGPERYSKVHPLRSPFPEYINQADFVKEEFTRAELVYDIKTLRVWIASCEAFCNELDEKISVLKEYCSSIKRVLSLENAKSLELILEKIRKDPGSDNRNLPTLNRNASIFVGDEMLYPAIVAFCGTVLENGLKWNPFARYGDIRCNLEDAISWREEFLRVAK